MAATARAKKILALDRQSGIQEKKGYVQLVPDLTAISSDLLGNIRHEIARARREIEGVIDNESGQLEMFPEFRGEASIPREYADEVIEEAQRGLAGTGVRLERRKDSVVVVRDETEEREDPYKEIGY